MRFHVKCSPTRIRPAAPRYEQSLRRDVSPRWPLPAVAGVWVGVGDELPTEALISPIVGPDETTPF